MQLTLDHVPRVPAQDAASDEWYTPRWLLAWLPPIALDPCYSAASSVVAMRTIDLRAGGDGLRDDWTLPDCLPDGAIVFCNPPYSDCATWVERCAQESKRMRVPIVALVPGYAGDQYWHRAVWGKAMWVGFIAGRIRFDTAHGRAKDSASFTSALICWGEPQAALDVLAHIQSKRAEYMDTRGVFVVDAAQSMRAK